MVVESVTPTGIASSFAGLHNRDGKEWLVSLFGAEPMEGQGAFIFVVYTDLNKPGRKLPFAISGEANEGLIPLAFPRESPDDAERLLTPAAEVGALFDLVCA